MKTSPLLFATLALILLTGCESTDSNGAYDRAQGRDAYVNELRTTQASSALSNRGGGSVPLMGVGVGSGTNGLQPFSNPDALYSIPQSR